MNTTATQRWSPNEADAVFRETKRLLEDSKKSGIDISQVKLYTEAQKVLPVERHRKLGLSSTACQLHKNYKAWLEGEKGPGYSKGRHVNNFDRRRKRTILFCVNCGTNLQTVNQQLNFCYGCGFDLRTVTFS